MQVSRSTFSVCAALVLFSTALLASSDDPEDFKFQVTGSGWMVNPSGQLFLKGVPFNLRSDLNVGQNQPTFYGKLVIKPGRRHRIVVEGTPFRLSGNRALNQTISVLNRQYTVQGAVTSTAQLDYLFAGYQYDVATGPIGHLGFSVGGAYVDASGAVHGTATILGSQLVTQDVSKSVSVGLPSAGAELRVCPIPHHPILEVNGEVRGMAFGDYGHYLEGGGNDGINLGHFAIEAGYRAVNADIHNTTQARSGIFAHLHGPIYSLVFRY